MRKKRRDCHVAQLRLTARLRSSQRRNSVSTAKRIGRITGSRLGRDLRILPSSPDGKVRGPSLHDAIKQPNYLRPLDIFAIFAYIFLQNFRCRTKRGGPIYYSEKNIDQKAAEFLAEIAHYRDGHNLTINPEHADLIVIDMQSYFLEKDSHAYVRSSPAVLNNIVRLQNAFLEHDLTLIQTRHLNTAKGARRMNQWWADAITEDNPLSEIDDRLQSDRAVIVQKEQYDAFLNTDLENILTKQGIRQLVITGVLTHLCCETTARSAFMRGFEVFFVIDGTATYSEEFHRATLLNLSHGFAVPILTREILEQLGRRNK